MIRLDFVLFDASKVAVLELTICHKSNILKSTSATALNTCGPPEIGAVNQIEVIHNQRTRTCELSYNNNNQVHRTHARARQLQEIKISRNLPETANKPDFIPPSLYLLNATSIAKLHAIQQLQADVL